jgi:RHS repeat-associated protein
LTTAYDTGGCTPGATQYQYDSWLDHALPSCPVVGACPRTGGRLAYVKVTLFCTPSQIDQETWYGYDDAGRLVREYVTDNSTRTADHQYAWSKGGALQQVTTPSGVVMGRTFGSAGSNSDTDLVTALWRTTTATPIIDAIQFYPYGRLKQYNQQNQIGGLLQRTVLARNLASRVTSAAVENQSNGVDTFSAAITEDLKGRVTTRDYTGGAAGVQDSYFLYDYVDRVLCETTSFVSSCPTSGSNIKNSRLSPYFTNAGDWNKLLRPVPGSTGGLMNSFNPSGYGTSHQVTMVRQDDGSPAIGDTVLAYDALGNRTSDDNMSTLTNDRRDYTYDVRRNVMNVHGKYFTGGLWHDYDVASAFDAKNRRVFKSFLDNTTLVQAQWYFYYDAFDRLIEVRYTPNTASSSTYSLFQLFWLGDRLALYWQTDYPSVTTTRRYVGTDETGRPLDMWTWPVSGDGSRVWAVDPTGWGFDTITVGPMLFQPILFTGQYSDSETVALENNGSTVHRSGIALNGFRTYDPFTGSFLQRDPIADRTWSSYSYADSNPVGTADPSGLEICPITSCGPGETPESIYTSGGSGCGKLCGGACAVGVGWAFGCACSECDPPPNPEDECAKKGPNCILEFGDHGDCYCAPTGEDGASNPTQPPKDDVWEPDFRPTRSSSCLAGGFIAGAIPVALIVGYSCSKSKPKYPGACTFIAGLAGLVSGGLTIDSANDACDKLVPVCDDGFRADYTYRPPGLRVASGAECAGVEWPNPQDHYHSYCCIY